MRSACQVPVALAGGVCLFALAGAPALAADADATPGLVAPSGTLSLLVSCDPVDGTAPEGIEAVSNAFNTETVKLKRHRSHQSERSEEPKRSERSRAEGQAAGGGNGPVYRGRATLAPASVLVPDAARESATRTSVWGVDGMCPGGEQWTASFRVDHESSRPDQGSRSPSPGTADGGPVSTGVGGAGEDYQPVSPGAVAAGSALIVGTVAVVVYRRMREVRTGS